MKVLLINGSARKSGNTSRALREIADELDRQGIESQIMQIGVQPVRGCVACLQCRKNNMNRCAFDDDLCNRINEQMASCDALIVASPVYYGQPNGALLALTQRMFYSGGALYKGKPAASVAVCRRGGATAAFQTMNMPFMLMNMPVVPSQYWNIVYGRDPGEAEQDSEGMQTMRTLAKNMAWMLKNMHGENSMPAPEQEAPQQMNFIR